MKYGVTTVPIAVLACCLAFAAARAQDVTVQGVWGVILAIVGAVVLAAGALNFCIFAPLFGGPFWARDIK